MANHSYVDGPKLSKNVAFLTLKNAVDFMWGDRLSVIDRDTFWEVTVPGSAIEHKPGSGKLLMHPGEDFGFSVQYHLDGMWEFRHPFNMWESWAQSKVMHMIAKSLGVSTYRDDSTDDILKVDPYELRGSYKQYLARNFNPPYSVDDLAWFDELLKQAPGGFRD